MWIITAYPDIVLSYEQYDDDNPFHPITLDCDIPASEAEKESGKFSAVVTYKSSYCDMDGKIIPVSFGLG